jgi:hypothetical protein
MEPILVLFARGAVNEFVKYLCLVSEAMGYSLWSLSGNPCSMGMRLPVASRRICILESDDIATDQISDQNVIGAVHIVRTSHLPQECRISFHLENLSGESIRQVDQQALQRFSVKAYMLLEADGLLFEEAVSSLGTGPFQLPNAQADTGPL